jgi:hypothetical protein
MRANEYALNSSAYGSASAPIQQALRTHLDEAAELLRDIRDLHHDYPEPEVRWPLAGALRDCGHSLGEVGRLEEARRLLYEVKGLSAGHPDPFMGSILLEAFLDPAFGPLWEGHDARKIFARFTALLYENRRAEAADLHPALEDLLVSALADEDKSLDELEARKHVRQIVFG